MHGIQRQRCRCSMRVCRNAALRQNVRFPRQLPTHTRRPSAKCETAPPLAPAPARWRSPAPLHIQNVARVSMGSFTTIQAAHEAMPWRAEPLHEISKWHDSQARRRPHLFVKVKLKHSQLWF